MENLADLLGFALLIFSLLAYLFFRHRPKMKGVTKALRTFGRAATTQIWLSANRPHIRSNYGQVDDSIRRRLWNVLPGLRLLYGALVTLGRVLTFWAAIVTGLRSSVVSSSL